MTIPSKIRPLCRRALHIVIAASSLSVSGLKAASEETLVPADLLSTVGDLEVTVWAQSPDLRNPTNMDIDYAGRIWVAEGVNYRRNKERDPKGDRITVIEDANRDGVADNSWTFVQDPELIAPLGIAVIDNKIYVSNTPNLIVYTDVDRNLVFDPRIDKREVLLTGFNGRNHDHSLHSVTFGPDGLLYLNHGNSGALVTDRSGKTVRVGSAYDGLVDQNSVPLYGIMPIEYAGAKSDDGHVYVGGFAMRIKPDGTDLEVIGHNFRNSYEQTVTSFGNVFQNDNDDPPASRTSYLLEYGNAGWFSNDGLQFWQADRRPGQDIPTSQWRQEDPGIMPAGDVYGAGAPTGIVFYEGDALGEGWRGTLLSCDAGRNVVLGYKPTLNGAGFQLDRFQFLTSNQNEEFSGIDGSGGKVSSDLKTFFRPSDVSVGPDGAIYVADWFDPRVGGHSDQDETVSGAIYQIAPKGFKSKIPSFDVNTVSGQIAALTSPAVNVRALGYVPLRAAGDASVEPVSKLLEHDNPFIRARAIWLLAQLGKDGVEKVESLLNDDDEKVRSTAFQALRSIDHRVLYHAEKLASDKSAKVRSEVAVAMRDVPFAQSKAIILKLARGYVAGDRTYLAAFGIAASGKEADVYIALREAMGNADPLEWTAEYRDLIWTITPEGAVGDFAKRAEAEQLTEKERMDAVTAIGFTPTKAAVDALLELSDSENEVIKDHARWWLINYRNTRWADHGVSEALKKRGIYDPDKIVVTASTIPRQDQQNAVSVEAVTVLNGNPERGASKAAICMACHKMGTAGPDYGPSLNGWANRQSLRATILSIVQPSEDIAHGFDGREVVLKDGTVVHGIIDSYNDPMVIRSMGGKTQQIPQERIESVNWYGRSLMLSADQMGLDAQDVADIIAFLKDLE